MLKNACAALFAALIAAPVGAATDSNLPDEGPVPVAEIPEDVMEAANRRCQGLLANKASFDWSRDTGMFTIEGRCQGFNVRILITGDGRVDYFTKLEDE